MSKPLSVAFFAQRNDDFNITAGQFVTYHFANVNEGNGLDISAGIFTSPVKGVYFFSFSAIKMSSPLFNKLTVRLMFLTTNETIAKGHVSSQEPYTWVPATLQATVSLNANDSVAVLLDEGTIYDPKIGNNGTKSLLTSFMGFLIIPN